MYKLPVTSVGRGSAGDFVNQRLPVGLAILVAILAQFGCGRQQRLTFQAKVADLGRQNNALAMNKRPDDFVEITVPGQLLRVPIAVSLVRRSEADWSTPEHAVASILSANMAGDLSWILDNFVPAERDAARKQLSDPAIARRTRDYYRYSGKVEMMGWAEVRGFDIVFMRGLDEDGDATFLAEVLSKTPSGWRQTQALSKDDTYDVVWTAIHAGSAR
jgi:hypothetical protein